MHPPSPLLRLLLLPKQPPRRTGTITKPPSHNFHLPTFATAFYPPPPRTLTAARNLPFPPEPLFRTISDIDSYARFLPFLTASTVTARDGETGYPTSAFLTVGYGPLSETFVSRVECDGERWTVGARSGWGGNGNGNGNGNGSGRGGDGGDGGLFEYLDTLWKLQPLRPRDHGHGHGHVRIGGGREETKVVLEVRFQFRSAMHAAMMGAVESQVAGMMIEAFEKRVRELDMAK
ncbi:hypothetical protein PAAG_06364 [Paracoccidioides lutzii Pb01]|uniref:Coenzyme Q-binding protein COQ10 START domain-containing protein n=1 Tax=Paracoccidioides lutzii (strain ATCC MYA-826 / Pb01) TaxID=502779 RepID=C1H6H3_PARBA|nr:hypothetical protein PAAG_06364 [Paracoccidioides lutzii Pb01]EEH35317.2 hypothetical protein PAAG_06364 [Paracoccidioides lutzii Pb01]